MTSCTLAGQSLTLSCYPDQAHDQQAWDAADVYLLEHAEPGAHTLILNDHWGALTTRLAADNRKIICWQDSWCAGESTRRNLTGNEIPDEHRTNITLITGQPFREGQGNDCDAIWIKCPKSFDQLHWWLLLASESGMAGTPVSLAGMAKHIPVKWLNWLEQHCDDYSQHLIRKKARLLTFSIPSSLPPLKALKGYEGPDGKLISALPGVFSRDHMDIGSRVLTDVLPDSIEGDIADLGCGNGLLSVTLAHRFPDIRLTLCDDSSLAVESARMNLSERSISADCVHTDTLKGVDKTFDWIVCNPPFHTGNQLSLTIAARMFSLSARKLRSGGHLLVVANRHLPYQKHFKRHFGGFRILSEDKRFTVYLCQKKSGSHR